jgi:hypothetical protein
MKRPAAPRAGPAGKKTKQQAGPAAQTGDWRKWVNDFKAASKWLEKQNLEARVEAAGGLVRVEDFLPGKTNSRWRLTSVSVHTAHLSAF